MDKRKADMRRQLQAGGGVKMGGRKGVKVSSRSKANSSNGFSRTAGASSGTMPAIRGGGGMSGRAAKSSTMSGRMQGGGSTRLPSVRGAGASGTGVRGARAVRKAW